MTARRRLRGAPAQVFGASLNLSGSGGLALGEFTVAGNVTGVINIAGDVGTIDISNLRSGISISGDATMITISDRLGFIEPVEGSAGSIFVSGGATIVDDVTTFALSDDTLYVL